MKLLITGGAGFIGSCAVLEFLRHDELELLVNLDCLTYAGNLASLSSVRDPRYVFVEADLCCAHDVEATVRRFEFTHVLHLAAESHVDRSIHGPGAFIQSNIVGTFNLLEALRRTRTLNRADVRYVQVSTDEVFGSLGPLGRFREDSPFAPNSPYSASKASADMLARAYRVTYGMPIIVTHCSNNFGPRQYPEKLIPVVIQRLLERQPIPVYGDGLNVRDWIHVCDHVSALWSVLCRGRVGESYNIGANCERSNLELVGTLCDTFDSLFPEVGGNSRQLISYVTDRPGHDRRYAIDSGKLACELGWHPAVSWETGIQETITWYAAHQDWVRTARQRTEEVSARRVR
jgi:dTDP-glucose 4,6-dehydratase